MMSRVSETWLWHARAFEAQSPSSLSRLDPPALRWPTGRLHEIRSRARISRPPTLMMTAPPEGRGRNPSVSPRRTIRLSPREAARSAGEGWRATPDSPERASGRLSKLLSRSAGARSRASSPGEGAAAHDYKIKLVTNSGRARDLMNKTWFRSWPVPGPSRRSGLLPLRCLRTDG